MVTTGGASYKTISFSDAIDKVLDERRERQDIQIPISKFSLSLNADGNEIVGTIDGQDYVPTEHCLKQMATWMGVSHAVLKQYMNPVLNQNGTVKYERDQTDLELLVALFKNGVRDSRIDPKKEFKFRTYNDGTLRAMLSDRYAIIDNVWYLEHLANVFKAIGGDEPGFVHWRGNADTLYGNLLIPDSIRKENDSDYGGMISVSNCEIGKRRLSLLPSVFRGICTNGCIFGLKRLANRISQVHRGDVNLTKLATSIHDGVDELIPMFASGIDKFVAMQDLKLEAMPSNMIAQIAQDHKLTPGGNGQAVAVASQFANYEKDSRNLFGIVNAITRAAQDYNPSEHVRLDEIAGVLMDHTEHSWKLYNSRANGMSEDQKNKIFGIVAA